MLRCYFLLASLVLTAFQAQAQLAYGPVTKLRVSALTATSATITFAGGSASGTCGGTSVEYAYAGGPWQSVPYAMPLVLNGLQPASEIAVRVIRRYRRVPMGLYGLIGPINPNPPQPCTESLADITFTTAAPPWATPAAAMRAAEVRATTAAIEASQFTLAPNPAHGRAALTLATGLPQPTVVEVRDALGHLMQQQVLPAHATTAALDVAGLPAGLYLVRAAGATVRLVVE